MFTNDQIEGLINADTTFSIGDPSQVVDCRYVYGEIGVGTAMKERTEKIIYAEHNYTPEIKQGDNIIINNQTKQIITFSKANGIIVIEL